MWVQQKDYKAVGAVLTAVREKSKLSQEELAARLSKPQSFVSSYENGQRRIDLLEFIRIMDAMGADAGEVFRVISRTSSASKPRAAKR
jgi:transcriptional regulator with XRE-family HTH domain